MPGIRKFTLTQRKGKTCTKSLHVSIPLNLLATPEFDKLKLVIQTSLPRGWTLVDSQNKIVIAKTVFVESEKEVATTFTVIIDDSFGWEVVLPEGHSVPKSSYIFHDFQFLREGDEVVSVLRALDSWTICIGNGDEKFQMLKQWKLGKFIGRREDVVAYVDRKLLPFPTIRRIDCLIVLPLTLKGPRCESCMKYRSSLRSIHLRQTHAAAVDLSSSSKANERWMSQTELKGKIVSLKQEKKAMCEKLRRVEAKLAELIENESIEVDDIVHSDLTNIMEQNTSSVLSKYPEGSFPVLFWKEQQQASKLKNSKNMRWHPFMIRWCLYLHHLSGKGYDLLRDSGCVSLPSTRTLRDYTYYNDTKIGFSTATDRELLHLIKDNQPWQNLVGITMDEMHICEGVVYDKHTGKITGFTDTGDINNHLERFESAINAGERSFAKTMLVLLVRGLCTGLQFPYAQFACRNLKAEVMYQPVTDAIFRLERLGLKVLSITADGASSNRLLFKLLSSGSDLPNSGIPYKVRNPFSDVDRSIFFISDPPHLLKTIRNCVANRKRDLWNDGKSILWDHIVDLYCEDSGSSASTAGLCLVPKLKYEHVYLNSFSKMRVDLAAQVMSESTSSALRKVQGPEAEGTADLLSVVDKFFDCLNVHNLREAKEKRKPFRSPYRCGKDWRLQWLKGTCLEYFEEWKKSVMKLKDSDVSLVEKKKMLLSKETLDGIHFTVKAFVELVEVIFETDGVKFFLSEHVSQDPLEKFFGIQRQRGRVNENPDVQSFCKNTQAIKVIGSICRDSVKGNCRGSNRKRPLQPLSSKDNEPLQKRRKRSAVPKRNKNKK